MHAYAVCVLCCPKITSLFVIFVDGLLFRLVYDGSLADWCVWRMTHVYPVCVVLQQVALCVMSVCVCVLPHSLVVVPRQALRNSLAKPSLSPIVRASAFVLDKVFPTTAEGRVLVRTAPAPRRAIQG